MKPQASPKITPPGADQEPELLALARSGDREAFASLYNAHRADVLRYVRSRTNDMDLAEDLVSETFLRALRRIDTFTWRGRDFGAWLVTIARNILHDHYRAARTRTEVCVGEVFEGAQPLEDSAETVGLRQLATTQTVANVHAALLELTPAQYDTIRLRYLDSLSVAETAAALGRSEGAVKTLAYRAFATMRTRLAVAA